MDLIHAFLEAVGQSAKTSIGFFWKSAWAFVLGYAVSGMIQAFVPKKKLTARMGSADFKSISLSTLFGAISSSCSFAALATARSLFRKGAHFIATVAFMFASTNLVIELGILILIFLGPSFLMAEIIGGLILILFSSVIIRMTFPKKWIDQARERQEARSEEKDFNWKKRIRSKEGWWLAGRNFVNEWQMAWEDIVIGFTIAGLVSFLVPANFWEAVFLQGYIGQLPELVIRLENALVAPFVAAATFIGSMGNIPLATVLSQNGVLFAGIMGFIYSDLMVPPLVNMNRKYYGTSVALYIAGVMYVSIVLTAITLSYGFDLVGNMPASDKEIGQVTAFAIDYTFWLNLLFVLVAGWMVRLFLKFQKDGDPEMAGGHHHHQSGAFKRGVVYACLAFLGGGILVYLLVL